MKYLILVMVVLSCISLILIAQDGKSINVFGVLFSVFLFTCMIPGTWYVLISAGQIPRRPKKNN